MERLVVDADPDPTPADATEPSLDDAYRAHFPHLMRVAYLMVGSNAVAEDLVHDVFLRCAPRLSTLDDPATYLRVATVNAARTHHRQRSRIADEPVEQTSTDASPADAVAVRTALMAMSPRRRAAVVLRFYDDMTHNDIADALGCRPATARSLVRRGLNDLRGALTDD